ncbi:MAG: aminopeptidase P family N-terminal domain-containing protein, partial [bacterium]
MFEKNIKNLKNRLADAEIDVAVITDDDSVYYYTGYYNYLHMEFGRPTILVVPSDGENLLITPTIDLAMADSSAQVDRIAPWNDGAGNEWREELPAALSGATTVAIEPDYMPPMVRTYMDSLVPGDKLFDVTPILSEMRMVKSTQELQ